MRFILASASPRRKELLSRLGIEYDVVVSEGEEKTDATEPAHIVEELSIYKCQNVAAGLKGNTDDLCIIGADTVVACDGEVLGKPADPEEAHDMLRKLSGRKHQVYTGVTLLVRKNGDQDTLVTFHEKTDVEMYDMSDEEIDGYIAGGEPMDKAGAYGIQGQAAVFIRKIDGDYYNVVGLPIGGLYHELTRLELI